MFELSLTGIGDNTMAWRTANSLLQYRDQLNAACPRRSKVSDGFVGDAAHASRDSDHNPWVKLAGMGIVTAGDFTHDPKNGVDCEKLYQALVASRDPRIKYIIWNRTITSGNGQTQPWVRRKYTGSNPHDKHLHISVHADAKLFDDRRPWAMPGAAVPPTGLRWPVIGAIRAAYDRPGIAARLGQPKGIEVPTLDKAGRWQEFDGGAIYWHPWADNGVAHVVWGAILETWRKVGSEPATGYPTTDEMTCPDGVGKYNHFTGVPGRGLTSIYWHPQTGAHVVWGAFREWWAANRYERGPLGYPRSGEYRNSAGVIVQDFQGGQLRYVNQKVIWVK